MEERVVTILIYHRTYVNLPTVEVVAMLIFYGETMKMKYYTVYKTQNENLCQSILHRRITGTPRFVWGVCTMVEHT